VTGVVALMLQANPNLTPNGVKAILEYTAEQYPGYNALTQGAGFLNAVGAVRLARFYKTARPGDVMPTQAMWSRHLIWGNRMVSHGTLDVTSNAFATGTSWGVAKSSRGENIVWGTAGDENIVWGTTIRVGNIVWGTAGDENVVWGTAGADENVVWGTDCGLADCNGVVWGTSDAENVVWGTADAAENIVWGTAALDAENIVWGTSDAENIVWGTAAGDENIVWGTADGDENIVWGTDAAENIVWGTTDGAGNIVWGTVGSLTSAWSTSPTGTQTPLTGRQLFDRLMDRDLLNLLEYAPPPPPPPPPPVPPPPRLIVPVGTPVVHSILYSGGVY
jgi:hypothetical protein